jgi:hypothetical protein
VLITAGRLHAPRVAVWLLPFRVSLHDVWVPAPDRSPSSSHAFALPSCIASFHLSSPQMGSTRVALLLLLLEERDLAGVGALQPSLGFKDFHHAARL